LTKEPSFIPLASDRTFKIRFSFFGIKFGQII
jgi:hypothetical protein